MSPRDHFFVGVIFKSVKWGSKGVGRKGRTSHQDTEQRGKGAHQLRGEIRDQRRKECQVQRRKLAGATETVPETQNRTWPSGLHHLRGTSGRRDSRKPLATQECFSSMVLPAVIMPPEVEPGSQPVIKSSGPSAQARPQLVFPSSHSPAASHVHLENHPWA